MKLLLTSTGLSNENVKQFFVNQFDRLDDKTAALVTCARNEEEQRWIDASKKELETLGVKVTEQNVALDDIFEEIPDYDIYYVCGGNTFHILDRMRKTRMEKVLVDAAGRGKIYIGVSAGSVLAGPDIKIIGRKINGDVNDIGLTDLVGLHLTPFLIYPHYGEENKNEVIDFKKYRFQEPVVALTDNQALYISDEENVLIGNTGGLQFCENCKLKDYTS